MTQLPDYDPFQKPASPPPRTSLWPLAALLGVILLGVLAWRWWQAQDEPLLDPTATPHPVMPRGALPADEQQVIELFEHASRSVVNITTSALQRDFLTLNLQEIPKGTGSGFIWEADKGYVVTNYHVVEEAGGSGQLIRVTLKDESVWKGRLVGGAPDFDLAVIKIDAPSNRLRQLPVGTSKDLKVGQKVFAIGNPFGLDQSLSMGIISALGREIRTTRSVIKGVIQTDAAINPGNSGGPLLDSAGRLIGVNTAIASPTGAYAGIGFAIPADTVNRIVPQIIQRGRIGRPGLGVTIADARLARRWGMSEGVLIMDVVPDGPAAKAGLRPTRIERGGRVIPGDVIVGIGDQAIASAEDLLDALAQHQVGEEVPITIFRDGKRQLLKVPLQEL
jgi:S1-C subfamily serine protease